LHLPHFFLTPIGNYFAENALGPDDNSKRAHHALAFQWSMIFSENRQPLFGIMLLVEHDLSEKPVSAFRDNGLMMEHRKHVLTVPPRVSHSATRRAINSSAGCFTTHEFSTLHRVCSVSARSAGTEAVGIRVASAQQFGHDRSVGT
jgi:hypothetical protein